MQNRNGLVVNVLSWEVAELASNPVRQGTVPRCREELWLLVGWQSQTALCSQQGYLDGSPNPRSAWAGQRVLGLSDGQFGWPVWPLGVFSPKTCLLGDLRSQAAQDREKNITEGESIQRLSLVGYKLWFRQSLYWNHGEFCWVTYDRFQVLHVCHKPPIQFTDPDFGMHRLRSLWNCLITVLQIRVS